MPFSGPFRYYSIFVLLFVTIRRFGGPTNSHNPEKKKNPTKMTYSDVDYLAWELPQSSNHIVLVWPRSNQNCQPVPPPQCETGAPSMCGPNFQFNGRFNVMAFPSIFAHPKL